MKKVFGLLGILALAASLTSGRNLKSDDPGPGSLKSTEGGVEPVCIVTAASGKKAFKVRYASPATTFRSSPSALIEQGLSAVTTEPLAAPLWLSELNQWRRMA